MTAGKTNWKHKTLGELGEFRNGVNFSKEHKGAGLKLINVKDIFQSGIVLDFSKLDRVDLSDIRNIQRYFVRKNDIFIVRSSVKREGIGLVSISKRSDLETVHCGFVIRFRPQENGCNPLFLAYLLRSPQYRPAIINLSSGAAITNISQDSLGRLTVALPSLAEQDSIVRILSAYDDLIENNTRRIQILEELSRRIYDEWFVRFRFPGHENVSMGESELGLIPDSWDVVRLEDQYKTGSGGTPSRKNPLFYGGNINWVKTQELNDGFIFESDEKITLEGLNNSSAKMFSAETVLIAMYGATIGALGILANPSSTNQACCAIIKSREPFGFEYAFLSLLANRSRLIELRAGAAQQNINQVVIKNFKILKPDDETVKTFNHLVNPSLKQISLLQKKNDILRRTRDLLLPKLISGELDVSNFPEPMTD